MLMFLNNVKEFAKFHTKHEYFLDLSFLYLELLFLFTTVTFVRIFVIEKCVPFT